VDNILANNPDITEKERASYFGYKIAIKSILTNLENANKKHKENENEVKNP